MPERRVRVQRPGRQPHAATVGWTSAASWSAVRSHSGSSESNPLSSLRRKPDAVVPEEPDYLALDP